MRPIPPIRAAAPIRPIIGLERDYAGAQAQFDILLSNDPNNPELLGTAALLDFELGFFEAAMKKFQQLIAGVSGSMRLITTLAASKCPGTATQRLSKHLAQVSREFRDAKAKAAELLADTHSRVTSEHFLMSSGEIIRAMQNSCSCSKQMPSAIGRERHEGLRPRPNRFPVLPAPIRSSHGT